MHKFHIRKRIHWRKFFTRKVITLAVLAVVLHYVGPFVHLHVLGHVVNRADELTSSVFIEHVFFGIPFEEAADVA